VTGPTAPNRAELVEAFAGFPERLAAAARRAAEDPARQPTAPGEWGPAEVVRHLIAVEAEVWQSRLALLAAVHDPHWPWTEPGVAPGFDGKPLDVILAAFASARAATTATIRALDDPGWARSGTHATYGVLDVAGLLRLAIDHDEDHLAGLLVEGRD
jgi:DinB superfamily